jgi:hypothetical protein
MGVSEKRNERYQPFYFEIIDFIANMARGQTTMDMLPCSLRLGRTVISTS